MKLIVGLGNPGQKYKNNRHNAGHMFVDYLNNELGGNAYKLQATSYKLVKTDCYMNVSGIFVKKLSTNYQLATSNLYIVHDDLDIPFGSFKIQFGTGPKVHNGLASIEEELGTNEFWRVRIGVDARPVTDRARRASGEEYVLSDFTSDELARLPDIFAQVATRLKTI